MDRAGDKSARVAAKPGIQRSDGDRVGRIDDPERLRRFFGEDHGFGMLPLDVGLVGRDEDLEKLRYLETTTKLVMSTQGGLRASPSSG